MNLRENLGGQYNKGVGRTAWRKQIDHNYCTKCKDEYKKQQEEELRKSNERADWFFYRRFLPGILIAFAVFITIMGLI